MISPAIVSKINMVKIRYNEKQGGRVERTRAQRRAKTSVNQTGGNRRPTARYETGLNSKFEFEIG